MKNQVNQIEKDPAKKLRWYEPDTGIIWINVVLISGIQIGGLYYFLTFPYSDHKLLITWTMFENYLTMFGILAGAHRYWSHRSFKAKLPLQIFLAICFYASVEPFKITNWVRNHRVHHKYVDTNGDPHNSTRGFWYSHIGWTMLKRNDEVQENRRKIDLSDIKRDAVVQFFDGHALIIKIILVFFMPLFVPLYIFNQDLKWTIISNYLMRYSLEINMASSINSLAHMFGNRSYDKSIRPTQNRFVALFAFGEGWHNYHHVFPWDYKSNEVRGFFFNATTFWIDVFAKIGWAYDLKEATAEHIQKIAEKKGDGSYHAILGY